MTITSDAVKANSKKPMTFVLTAVDAAKPTPFTDKIVRVQAVAGNRTEIFTLENVKLTTLLGNNFITGTAVKYRNDRFSGSEVYLNLRDVLTIVAMTPEQAKKFNESRPRRSSNQPQRGQGPFVPPQGYFPPQGPYMPGFNPQQPEQGPSLPQPGFNPQPPRGQYNPPQGFNFQPRFNRLQGGQDPNMPPPGFNPPQGGQPDRNQPRDPSYPEAR